MCKYIFTMVIVTLVTVKAAVSTSASQNSHLQRILDHTLDTKIILFLHMLNWYTFNDTLDIASPIFTLKMDFLKEEIFFICSININLFVRRIEELKKIFQNKFP